MNIFLYNKKDVRRDNTIEIKGENLNHIKKVLKLKKGDVFKTGEINGLTGEGEILYMDSSKAIAMVSPKEQPPAPLDLMLIIALPRPKVARRVIYNAAMLGVKKIWIINSARVEKSYWQSPYISEEQIEKQIIKGLEQSCDTIMPEVIKKTLFKPFVEDELPIILKDKIGYLLDPYSTEKLPKSPPPGKSVIITGPEGGFIPYENEKINLAGAKSFNMGKRVLRVETSVIAAVSRFIP